MLWKKAQEQLRNAGVIPPLERMTGRTEGVTNVRQRASAKAASVLTIKVTELLSRCLQDCIATANRRATARQNKKGERRDTDCCCRRLSVYYSLW